jgi:putative hemolysin
VADTGPNHRSLNAKEKTMNITFKRTSIIAFSLLLTACAAARVSPATEVVPGVTSQPNMPTPAAVYCEQQGYQTEIRTATDGSQTGFCLFPGGSECDVWAYYHGECKPSGTATAIPLTFPTPLPIDPAEYQQGWWTYTNSGYGFSIMLPEDWSVNENNGSEPLMNDQLLILQPVHDPGRETIRMTFRRPGDDMPLWPTGVGQGAFFANGSLDIAGQPAQRMLLVCPTGDVTAIWYHQAEGEPNISRGGLEFGFIYSMDGHCQAGLNLSGKIQRVGEMIIASLKVP